MLHDLPNAQSSDACIEISTVARETGEDTSSESSSDSTVCSVTHQASEQKLRKEMPVETAKKPFENK